MPSRCGQGQLELCLYILSTYEVYLKRIQLKLSTSFCTHCSQCTNHLASAHKLLSPLPTHGYYGANFSPILTAVYFHDLHAPSRHAVSVQERCGTVHCYIHQSHDLHSALNINCIWNEIVSFNKLPTHLVTVLKATSYKGLHIRILYWLLAVSSSSHNS